MHWKPDYPTVRIVHGGVIKPIKNEKNFLKIENEQRNSFNRYACHIRYVLQNDRMPLKQI